jgi:ATP-binding cassette subfamily B protein
VLESGNKAEFAEESGRLRGFAVRAARLSALYMPLVILLASSGTALVLGAGGRLVMDGLLSYGELIAFIAYTMMIFDPAREVARVLSEFQAAQASAERLVSLIETEPEIVDLPDARAEGSFSGEIRFDNVSFEYGDGTWIFRDFFLVIPAGQTVALVGETGSGKSTFVNLICRFYEPVSGRILVDGTDYREYTQNWLHRKLGYVLQTPQLFSGTIRENIRYGRLDATDEDIEDAARGANALGFIRELEFGFDTRVGEGGALLSTGQKQLISLARALVCNPTLMILDEATSSVDTETEVLVQDAINTVLKGRTSIVIAHRLSTIRNADRILVMEDGEVLEDGSHDELMAARGRYHSLYTRQFLDESLDVSVQTD